MAMYALGVTPLIKNLSHKCSNTTHIWFADDSVAASSLTNLREWWNNLIELGPLFGYDVNVSKCWLVVKPHLFEQAQNLFHSTGIQISEKGRPYLGAALCQSCFVDEFVSSKVSGWIKELGTLCNIAQSQPHAAYSSLVHGVMSKWAYLQCMIPNASHLFQPLEDAIRHRLLPSITGQTALSEVLRRTLELPACLGELGIPNSASSAQHAYDTSAQICSPLQEAILQPGDSSYSSYAYEQATAKEEVKQNQRSQNELKKESLLREAAPDLLRSLTLISQHGASAWLTALPLKQHNFWLHKGDFRDALCLRYNWPLKFIALTCICGQLQSVEHALSCSRGGFPTLHHNEVRDITASYLSGVRSNITVEPHLQPLSGESLRLATSNNDDAARVDIAVDGFLANTSRTFFDVRVFNPRAQSNASLSPTAAYRRHKRKKSRAYEQHICEVEHGSYTLLIFSTFGGMGLLASTFYTTR